MNRPRLDITSDDYRLSGIDTKIGLPSSEPDRPPCVMYFISPSHADFYVTYCVKNQSRDL